MARIPKAKSKFKSANALPAKKTRKQRVGNVRASILNALRAGSFNRPALQKATGASYNGLVMHLSKLKDEGLVTFDASNRIVTLTGAAPAVPKGAKRPAKHPVPASVAPPVSDSNLPIPMVDAPGLPVPNSPSTFHLQDALNQFSSRLRPVEALDEKLLVLDQLGDEIGGPIAKVLAGIKADILGR